MSYMPRLAEYFSKPLGYYTDSNLEYYFTSTNQALALKDVSSKDILEIQVVNKVIEKDVIKNNILLRRDSRRY